MIAEQQSKSYNNWKTVDGGLIFELYLEAASNRQ